MSRSSSGNKWLRIATGIVVLLLAILAGALIGSAVLRFTAGPTSSGFDGIADALGALMLGSLGGALVGAGLLFWSKGRGHAVLIGAMLALVIGGVVLNAAAPRRKFATPVRPIPFEPHFEIKLYSRAAPGTTTAPTTDKGFIYRELSVSATDRELLAKGWGRTRPVCSLELSESELQSFSELASELYELNPAGCEPDGPGYTLITSWLQDTQGAYVEPGCFSTIPQIQTFLDQIESIVALRRDENPGCPG